MGSTARARGRSLNSGGMTEWRRQGVQKMFMAKSKPDYVSIFVGDGVKDQQLPLSMTKTFQHWIL